MTEVSFTNNVLSFNLCDFSECGGTLTIGTQHKFVIFLSSPLDLSINNISTRLVNSLVFTSPDFSVFSLLTINISKSTISFLLGNDESSCGVLEILLLFLGVFSLGLLVNGEEISAFLSNLNLEELALLGIAIGSDRVVLIVIMNKANLNISEVKSEVIVCHEEDTIVFSSFVQFDLLFVLSGEEFEVRMFITPVTTPFLFTPRVSELN